MFRRIVETRKTTPQSPNKARTVRTRHTAKKTKNILPFSFLFLRCELWRWWSVKGIQRSKFQTSPNLPHNISQWRKKKAGYSSTKISNNCVHEILKVWGILRRHSTTSLLIPPSFVQEGGHCSSTRIQPSIRTVVPRTRDKNEIFWKPPHHVGGHRRLPWRRHHRWH